jgi:hypothetical protein
MFASRIFSISLVELEVLEDAAHVRREALDVADQVLVDVVGVALQLLEVERRVVVEALAGGLVELVERVAFELAALARSYSARTLALVGASTQSKRRSTVMGA